MLLQPNGVAGAIELAARLGVEDPFLDLPIPVRRTRPFGDVHLERVWDCDQECCADTDGECRSERLSLCGNPLDGEALDSTVAELLEADDLCGSCFHPDARGAYDTWASDPGNLLRLLLAVDSHLEARALLASAHAQGVATLSMAAALEEAAWLLVNATRAVRARKAPEWAGILPKLAQLIQESYPLVAAVAATPMVRSQVLDLLGRCPPGSPKGPHALVWNAPREQLRRELLDRQYLALLPWLALESPTTTVVVVEGAPLQALLGTSPRTRPFVAALDEPISAPELETALALWKSAAPGDELATLASALRAARGVHA